jgi:hypothetical protein
MVLFVYTGVTALVLATVFLLNSWQCWKWSVLVRKHMTFTCTVHLESCRALIQGGSGFGGLVVSILASGTPSLQVQTRPKPPDFFGLPSEGK